MVETEKKLILVIEKNIIAERSILIVKIEGILDCQSSQYFYDTILKAISSDKVDIILECSNLKDISTCGIGILESIKKKIITNNRKFIFCGLKEELIQKIKLLDLSTEEYTNMPDIDSAIAKITTIFPVIFECYGCGKKIKVNKSGRFKCPECKKIISVSVSGDIQTE